MQERELSWLTAAQVVELVNSIRDGCDNPHTLSVALICLATDARWSEAERLGPQSLRGSVVTFSGTKSGKVRSVPIPEHLVQLLRDHWEGMAISRPALRRFGVLWRGPRSVFHLVKQPMPCGTRSPATLCKAGGIS